MVEFINLNKTPREVISLNKKGHYLIFMNNISGKFTVELNESDIEVDIFGLFVGKKTDQFVVETIQHHKAPRSTSNLFIKGVFTDESKFNYQGLIRIEKEGQQSHAYQKNQNLILSSKSFVESKPYLEILANDVFCTHGSTTGRLNEEQLFYTKSRGLSESDSKKLLINGFINEIVEKVKQKVPEFEMENVPI